MADKELELVVKFTGKLSDELDQALNKLRSTIQNTVKIGTEPLTKSINQLTQAKQKTTKAIQEQEHAIGRLTKHFSGLFDNIGSVISAQIRWYTTQSLIFGIVNAVKDATNSYKELQQEVKNVAAITGATAKEEKILMDAAREAGRTTAIAAHEASDAMLMLAQAGYSAGESAQALIPITKTMTVTGDSAATVVDLLTTAMSVWHKTTEDSYDILNELVKGMDATKLTMGDMKTAFSLAAGVAEISNFSMLEFISTLGFLKDRGEKAGTAARGLRQILLQLGKAAEDPSNALSKRFRELGIDIAKINPLTNEFNDILRELERGSFTAADAMSYLPANAAETMIRMIGAADAIEAYNKNIKNAPELNTKFAKSMEGIQNQLTKLSGRFKDLFYTLFIEYTQNIQNLIDQFGQLVLVFEVLLGKESASREDIKRMGDTFSTLAGILEGAIGGFSIMIDTWLLGIKLMASATYSAIMVIYKSFNMLKEGFGSVYTFIKDVISKKSIMGPYEEHLKRWEKIQNETWEDVKSYASATLDVMSEDYKVYLKSVEDARKAHEDRMNILFGKKEPEREKSEGRGTSTEETQKRLQREKESLSQFMTQYKDFQIKQAREELGFIDETKRKILEMELKTLEAKGNYGEEWLTIKEKLAKNELLTETNLLTDKIAFEKALTAKKVEILAEQIDKQISLIQKRSDEETKIRNRDIIKRAAEANIEKKQAETLAQAQIDAATGFFDRLAALLAKDDLKKPFEVWADFALSQINKISDGIGSAFANAIVEGKNLQEELDRIWKGIATDLIRELTSQAVKSAIAMLFSSKGGGGSAGYGAGVGGWGGLIQMVLDWFGTGHSGGLVKDLPSYHSGGLNANETVAKLRTDEYVMGPLATKKIGVNNLDEMNRTGQAKEQEKPQVNVPVQVINVTDPQEIARYITENPNVIINVVARDKRFHGEMKRIIREG